MIDYRYRALPWNIVFGKNAIQRLPAELDTLGKSRALVLSTPNQADDGRRVAKLLADRCVGLFAQAVMHVPAATVEAAKKEAVRLDADCTVAIGGGSTTGLGKALALQLDLDNVVIPTSYAGSEMTNIWGITENGIKTTGRDDRVLPTLTLYDPVLTLSLPPKFAASSGLNAMAQAAVNVASDSLNPMVRVMAVAAVKLLAQSLPTVLTSPDDLDARAGALLGASLAGGALGTGSTGLHHRLCHVLGGAFNTPHAETHTVLLPHSIAYNTAVTRAGTSELAAALQVDDAALGIFNLASLLGAPTALSELGVQASDLDEAARLVTATPFGNPAPVTLDGVRGLLEAAYHGRPPRPQS